MELSRFNFLPTAGGSELLLLALSMIVPYPLLFASQVKIFMGFLLFVETGLEFFRRTGANYNEGFSLSLDIRRVDRSLLSSAKRKFFYFCYKMIEANCFS